jgi:multicomponent Na+:H+ antiporter subunit B
VIGSGQIADWVLLSLLVATAITIVRLRSLFATVMLTAVFSLLGAGWMLVLDAPDVAFTEAAVGAGISTVLTLATLSLTSRRAKRVEQRPVMPMLLVGLTGAALVYGTLDMPHFGDPAAPAHQHVAPRYLERSPGEVGVPNIVTAVLASYRGYDTLGETTVIFAAGVAVLLLLGGPVRAVRPVPRRLRPGRRFPGRRDRGRRPDPVRPGLRAARVATGGGAGVGPAPRRRRRAALRRHRRGLAVQGGQLPRLRRAEARPASRAARRHPADRTGRGDHRRRGDADDLLRLQRPGAVVVSGPAGLFNYWVVVFLMMTGFYIVISRGNLVKKVIGLNIFQVSVFLLYITVGKVAGGTAPIMVKGAPADQAYSNPLPSVLILTAIVVGVATTAVALALIVRIREAFDSIEEDEIEEAELEAGG